MSNKTSQGVQDFFEQTVENDQTPQNQKLIFDPTTGELVVQRKNEALPNPDAVVADQIAEEGFFEKSSFLYI